MRFLDLFSGIGGFALGLERAGMNVAAFCEIDPFCRAVLSKHWPNVPVFSDIRGLTKQILWNSGVISNELPIELICGGFPCQPFSYAGKRRGKADDRYLWPEMLRIIREIRPAWVLGENVAGIVNMVLDDILSNLENQGYETAAFIIPACAVNAPHKRDRVWIVAYSAGMECQSRAKKQEALRRMSADGEKCDNVDRSSEAQSGKDVAYSADERLERGIYKARQIARPNKNEGETESRLGGVLNGISSWLDDYKWPALFGFDQYEWEPPRLAEEKIPYRKQRLMALGNAVVPQVVEVIGRVILMAEGCTAL